MWAALALCTGVFDPAVLASTALQACLLPFAMRARIALRAESVSLAHGGIRCSACNCCATSRVDSQRQCTVGNVTRVFP